MRKKRYQPGKNVSIRFPLSFPQEVLHFLNEKEITPTDLILEGFKSIKVKKNEVISVPPGILSHEQIACIEESPELKRVVLKLIDAVVFGDKPLFFSLNAKKEEEKEVVVDEALANYGKDMFDFN